MTETEVLPKDLNDIVKAGARMFRMVKERAVDRAKIEGLDKSERVAVEGAEFYNKFEEFALMKLAFYECFKCKLPYYGGMRDCAAGIQQQEMQEEIKQGEEEIKEQPAPQRRSKPEDFLCGLC
jgi:E3 ubiquitin-protein ligase MYCBP2